MKRIACGARNLIAPFPVSPSGGKPGRAGSPHAGSTPRTSKKRWHAAMLPAPPTRGAAAPLCIPRSRTQHVTATGLKECTLYCKADRSLIIKSGHLDKLATGSCFFARATEPLGGSPLVSCNLIGLL